MEGTDQSETGRVMVFLRTQNGNIAKQKLEFTKPDDPAIKGKQFKPSKITVDKEGRVYCIAKNVYEGIIDFDIVQTIYTGKELKPIEVVFEEEINFEIKIIYENNIEPGEAKAIIKVGNASVEYPFTIVRDEDLNPEEAINITQTGINNISNDNVKNDEDLQNDMVKIKYSGTGRFNPNFYYTGDLSKFADVRKEYTDFKSDI
jgi:uncharacterized cupredoxin-like copper-binding protein